MPPQPDLLAGRRLCRHRPRAHGRLAGEAFRQRPEAAAWLAAVERDGHATAERERLDPATRAEELVMMGLRLSGGIDAETFAAAAGMPLGAALDPAGLARMVEGGFVAWDGTGLRATPRGRLVLTSLTAELLG